MDSSGFSFLDHIDEPWTRYVDILVGTQGPVSPAEARRLERLALELAELHEQEAAEYRKRAMVWRHVQAGEPEQA